MTQELGKIEEVETYEEKTVAWEIPNFSSVISSEVRKFDASSDDFFICLGGVYSKKSPNFSFVNKSWYFQLCTKDSAYTICMKGSGVDRNHCSVKYYTDVKKMDGSVTHIGSGTWGESYYTFDYEVSDEVILPDLGEQSELTSSDTLTVICTLKGHGPPLSTQPGVLGKSKIQKLIKHDALSENFKDLLLYREACDTYLCVKDKQYIAHKTVLIARSPVFKVMFQYDTKERQTGIITIPDCDPESFNEFLEYLYCGELEVPSFSSALHLYETSDKYDVQELKAFCKTYAMKNLTVENMCYVVILADKYDDEKLFSASQYFFNKNLHEMFQASEWDSLMKNNLRLASKLLKGIPKTKFVK